jgi:hypothetical protein
MERHALIKKALDEQAERLRQQREQEKQQQLQQGEQTTEGSDLQQLLLTTAATEQSLETQQQQQQQQLQTSTALPPLPDKHPIVTASTKLSDLQPNVLLIHAEKCTGTRAEPTTWDV